MITRYHNYNVMMLSFCQVTQPYFATTRLLAFLAVLTKNLRNTYDHRP